LHPDGSQLQQQSSSGSSSMSAPVSGQVTLNETGVGAPSSAQDAARLDGQTWLDDVGQILILGPVSVTRGITLCRDSQGCVVTCNGMPWVTSNHTRFHGGYTILYKWPGMGPNLCKRHLTVCCKQGLYCVNS
jgi:hypothetical protein